MKTDTRSAAWTSRAELDRQADSFAAAARNLAAAKESGEIVRIQSNVRETGATGKSCHDRLRKD